MNFSNSKYAKLDSGSWRPYTSKEEVFSSVPVSERTWSQSFNVGGVEYWFKYDLQNPGLVKKPKRWNDYFNKDETILQSYLGSSGSQITGDERQVVGFDADGKQTATTLGWAQLSDQPFPPEFDNGVLTMTRVDGTDEFGMLQVAVNSTFESEAKPNSIPFYNPGNIGTGGATLPVANGIKPGDAVNKSQLDIRVPIPPTTGTYVLTSTSGVISWVVKT